MGESSKKRKRSSKETPREDSRKKIKKSSKVSKGTPKDAPAEPTPSQATPSKTTSKGRKRVSFAPSPVKPAIVAQVSTMSETPVIALSHGPRAPADVPFTKIPRNDPQFRRLTGSKKDGLALRADGNKTMQFTAGKDPSEPAQGPAMKHFLAVYDPKTRKVEAVEATKMIMRGVVRAHMMDEDGMEDKVMSSYTGQKDALQEAFGTRKAKAALETARLNEISSSTAGKMDKAAKATMNQIGEVTKNMHTREELQTAADAARPIPQGNFKAEEIQDVYKPKEIIGTDIFPLIPVEDWQETLEAGESISVPSRFLARRLAKIAQGSRVVTHLRIARYLLFCIIFLGCSRPGKQRGSRRLPPKEKLREFMTPAPEPVIESIRRRFSEAGEIRKIHADLLATHCCVFASILENFEFDVTDLKDDLKLDQKGINTYFREIGGRVKQVAVKEEGKGKGSESTGRSRFVAKLKLPLEFPRQRHLAPKRR